MAYNDETGKLLQLWWMLSVGINIDVKPKNRWTMIKSDVKAGLNMSFFLFPFTLKLLKIKLICRKVSLEQTYHGSPA